MRYSYWSNSKFADWLRTKLGLPEQPCSATAEAWEEFHIKEKVANAFGVKIIDSLDSVQSVVYFIPDMFSRMINFVGNVKHGSHILKTRVKFGQYSDLTNKISDALMLSIIEFIENECFHSSICWYSESPIEWPESVIRYKESGRISRLLGLCKVSDITRAAMGLGYIKYQIDNSSDPQHYYDIIDAYRFAKYRYLTFDASKESGYDDYSSRNPTKSFMKIDEVDRSFFDAMDILENEFDENVTKHCAAIIKHRKFLWT